VGGERDRRVNLPRKGPTGPGPSVEDLNHKADDPYQNITSVVQNRAENGGVLPGLDGRVENQGPRAALTPGTERRRTVLPDPPSSKSSGDETGTLEEPSYDHGR
jgi:hypothetical protein